MIATCIHFSRHGTVTGASHPRGRLSGLERHAGETAVAPLVVQRPQVRAALIEGMRPSAAVCRAAASGAGGVACLGLVTAGHKYVLLLSRTLCAAMYCLTLGKLVFRGEFIKGEYTRSRREMQVVHK